MLDIILGIIISFFAAFGAVEFVKFIYNQVNKKNSKVYSVILVKNQYNEVEGIVRNAIICADTPNIIVVDFGSTDNTLDILYKLCERYCCLTVFTAEQYIEFIKGC